MKKSSWKVADAIDIEGYSRIDTFMNVKTGELTSIEANTIPGLKPSTVIYHQTLIEKIIEIGKRRYKRQNKKKS